MYEDVTTNTDSYLRSNAMNAPNWEEIMTNRNNDPTHHVIKQMTMMLKTHSPVHKDMSHEDIYNSAVSYADSILNPENQSLPTP